jgi:hypothetical protein
MIVANRHKVKYVLHVSRIGTFDFDGRIEVKMNMTIDIQIRKVKE